MTDIIGYNPLNLLCKWAIFVYFLANNDDDMSLLKTVIFLLSISATYLDKMEFNHIFKFLLVYGVISISTRLVEQLLELIVFWHRNELWLLFSLLKLEPILTKRPELLEVGLCRCILEEDIVT